MIDTKTLQPWRWGEDDFIVSISGEEVEEEGGYYGIGVGVKTRGRGGVSKYVGTPATDANRDALLLQ